MSSEVQAGDRWTRETLLAFLDARAIRYEEVVHPAVFTMAESGALSLSLPGCRCKNLLVQNKKGTERYLVVTSPDAAVDLAALGRLLGCGRLSLCPAPVMVDLLGVESGAMSPFALVADREAQRVRLVLDESLAAVACFQFHPLVNTATVAIEREAFAQFLAAVGHALDFQDVPRRSV